MRYFPGLVCSIAALFSFSVFAQPEKPSCSALKSALYAGKSASLNNKQIRLTEKYDVKHYLLDVEVSHLNTFISGQVRMTAQARQPLDTILFELFESLQVQSIRLNGTPTPFVRQGSALILPCNIGSGGQFTVETSYSGTPPTAASNPLGGSGLTNGTSPSWGNKVTWSLSQPYSAYEWWPCKQSLRDKIDSVEVRITVPNACKAGSNGLLKQVVDLGNGKARYDWIHRHPIVYYLISIAVAEYVEYAFKAPLPGSADSLLIQNFIYNNPATLPFFKDEIDLTARFIQIFSRMFGPYPFKDEKYGHCMAPLGGGMEHQTMTTQGSFNKTLTAHELAHQWFGNSTTCASWADLWVNEGFARYSEYLMLEDLYPGEEKEAMLAYHNSVMQQAGGAVWVRDSLNGTRLFSSRLTYNKGGAILHTFRYLLQNDSIFFRALKKYHQRFIDSTAFGADFMQVLEEESGLDFAPAFEQWYYGEGFPTYTARWNNVNGDLHLRLSHTTSMPSVTPTFTTPLEILFRRTSGTDTLVRFAINQNTEWIVVPGMGNVQSILSLDPANWIINRNGSTSRDPNLLITSTKENLPNFEEIQVFPNPASDFIQLKTSLGKANYTLYDSKGQRLASADFFDTTRLDISAFRGRFFHLLIENEKGSKTIHKLIRR